MKRVALSIVISAAALAACAGAMAQEGAPQAAASGTPAPAWSWPERLENVEVLPADIGVDRLRETMIGFTRNLGVRCSFCHVGSGPDLSTYDFVSDDNPHKDVARAMMRMTRAINGEHLANIEGHGEARATCYTCHRGQAIPLSAPPPEGE